MTEKFLLLLTLLCGSMAFNIPSSMTVEFSLYTYSRGADIWPPTNEEPIKIQDSFPENVEIDVPVPEKRRPFEKLPLFIAASLIQYVKPLEILFVVAISGYLAILLQFCQATRSDGRTPMLPALPPQGHVPTLVSNPLGMIKLSKLYDIWLKAGILVGLVAPFGLVLRYKTTHGMAAARALFILCSQGITESITRRLTTPLPIKILVPLLYNALRLYYIFDWLAASTGIGRIVALSNLIYGCVNLFGFIIPVASMKYLRAHFFCVEAESVVTRPGLEETIGLSPF